MTAPLDEKARDAALAAWFANTVQGWHAAMEAAIRAYLAASPSPSEMDVARKLRERSGFMCEAGHDDDAELDLEAADALDQAQSALAAMRAERDHLAAENEIMAKSAQDAWVKHGGNEIALGQWKARADSAEAQVLRLTEENEALRNERDEADNALVDKYRDPKTGSFNFPSDVAAIVRRLDTAEARIKALEEALETVIAAYDDCSGAEPSLSVLHRTIDIDARSALQENAL